jgi:hypothetical protein
VRTLEDFGLPAGRYPATIQEVAVIGPERGKPWRMRITAKVERNGAEVMVFRPLGRGADPYELTAGQHNGLIGFATQFGWQRNGGSPAEELVAFVKGLVGTRVTAHVRQGLQGLAVAFYGMHEDVEHDRRAVAGEVLDKLPTVEPEYRERTLHAQHAHEQLLAGLGHAHRGLALAAEACWCLHREEGWVALGYRNISHYLASPELAMSRSQFYAFADMWQTYVVDGGVEGKRLCAPSKLEIPLPALKAGKVTATEALADAEALGLRDLRAKYRGDRDDAREEEGDGRSAKSGRPDFPLPCPACGVLIESASEVNAEGIVYEGHRWPAAWTNEQVLAAVQAAVMVARS